MAGAAALCAAGAWLLSEPVALRGLVAATAAAAATGAFLMRSWDAAAGRRVADLLRARESEEWKSEERIAELEGDIEESREMRTRLDTKLRAKRVELARLRGEHAALLRRYATAETARATALEGRRQLAIEAAGEPKALLPAPHVPGESAYFRAARALEDLTRNGAAQQTRRILEDARRRELAERAAREAAAEEERARLAAEADAKARAEKAAKAERERADRKRRADAAVAEHTRPSSALPLKARSMSSLPATRTPASGSAIAPYNRRHRLQRGPQGGFDFFGTQKEDAAPEASGTAAATEDRTADRAAVDTGSRGDDTPVTEAVQPEPARHEDPADGAGEEAPAIQRRSEDRAVGQVIDLTEHDETGSDEPESKSTGPLPLRSAIGG